MHNLEVFTAKGYSSKTLNDKNLLELRWNIFLVDLKKRDIESENASAILIIIVSKYINIFSCQID